MIERVLLVAWKGSSATAWVEQLRSGGFTVLLEDTTGERAWRTAKELSWVPLATSGLTIVGLVAFLAMFQAAMS